LEVQVVKRFGQKACIFYIYTKPTAIRLWASAVSACTVEALILHQTFIKQITYEELDIKDTLA